MDLGLLNHTVIHAFPSRIRLFMHFQVGVGRAQQYGRKSS